MLLKSWATPPASLPTASIFCACASCCCRSISLVTSRLTATKLMISPFWSRIGEIDISSWYTEPSLRRLVSLPVQTEPEEITAHISA